MFQPRNICFVLFRASLPLTILKFPFQNRRISRAMEQPKYHNLLFLYSEVNCIRESFEQSAPETLVHFSV